MLIGHRMSEKHQYVIVLTVSIWLYQYQGLSSYVDKFMVDLKTRSSLRHMRNWFHTWACEIPKLVYLPHYIYLIKCTSTQPQFHIYTKWGCRMRMTGEFNGGRLRGHWYCQYVHLILCLRFCPLQTSDFPFQSPPPLAPGREPTITNMTLIINHFFRCCLFKFVHPPVHHASSSIGLPHQFWHQRRYWSCAYSMPFAAWLHLLGWPKSSHSESFTASSYCKDLHEICPRNSTGPALWQVNCKWNTYKGHSSSKCGSPTLKIIKLQECRMPNTVQIIWDAY